MESLILLFLALLHSPDTYGHLFYAFILTGTWFVGHKKKIGWVFRVVGDLGWVVVGWHLGLSSVMIWSSIFALNEVRNYLIWKWSEDENKQLQSQRSRVAKTCSKKDKGNIQPSRRRRSIETDGVARAGLNDEPLGIFKDAPFYRVQKYKVVPKPKRAGTSKGKRKARANSGGSVETSWKGVRKKPSVSKPRGLPKTDKGKK